ncbi:cell envelope-like function transcriptional attenuator common domain protein [Gleimia coleocanis DSM 15436]|uniref:Cell envelope-like function transcriptional attenuator common domain protein n=1 Tax=Gleimia coleocanis DSM 15436 TaxID=525245 RepID=C0VZR9_9ACTO|nr:LCP family protein [Gleimia coleocanis]EEH63778.1 cell envelope-like function transcriptional attenuator common domain protein [Gleimia coleocanis DSM 15436]
MTNLPPSIPPQNPRRRPTVNGRSENLPSADAKSSSQRPRELRPRPEIKRDPTRKRVSHQPAENQRTQHPTERTTPPPSFQPTHSRTRRNTEAEHRPVVERRSLTSSTPVAQSSTAVRRTGARPAQQTKSAGAPRRQPPAFIPRGRESVNPPAKPAVTVGNTHPPARKKPGKLKKVFLGSTVVVLAMFLGLSAWIYSLWNLADDSLKHTAALSGAANTPGTTYLLAGSDSREDSFFQDETEGRRSDTIMLVHKADNGQVAMVSLPRDTFVNIPGYGEEKLNAAYSLGGPELLVSTVEELTGLTIDNYVEVGMDGVTKVVDSVGGVPLCLDYDVSDPYSTLEWTAGCHTVDGKTALAFARMRYADPEGDIGRAKRQRQVVANVADKVISKETFTSPSQLRKVVSVGSSALTVDNDTSALDVAYLGMYFREASNSGLTGVPPIASLDYSTYAGSAVLLDPEAAPEFFRKLAAGTLTKTDFWQGQ